MELILQSTPAEKQRLLPFLEEFARQHHLPSTVAHAADLALEEHLTNVMSYAYKDAALHEIRVRLEIDHQRLRIEVQDDGIPFDPLSHRAVDTTLPPEEKPVGGLGIHLIRSVMDDVQYERKAGRNILRMWKTLG